MRRFLLRWMHKLLLKDVRLTSLFVCIRKTKVLCSVTAKCSTANCGTNEFSLSEVYEVHASVTQKVTVLCSVTPSTLVAH